MRRRRSTPLYITIAAAKRLTGIDRPIEAAIADGTLRVIRAGTWRRVRWADVLAWLDTLSGDDRRAS
jgi:hypothetical protein